MQDQWGSGQTARVTFSMVIDNGAQDRPAVQHPGARRHRFADVAPDSSSDHVQSKKYAVLEEGDSGVSRREMRGNDGSTTLMAVRNGAGWVGERTGARSNLDGCRGEHYGPD